MPRVELEEVQHLGLRSCLPVSTELTSLSCFSRSAPLDCELPEVGARFSFVNPALYVVDTSAR